MLTVTGAPELPRLTESGSTPEPDTDRPPPPIAKDHIRTSSSMSRPPPPPKEIDRRRSRSSMLQVVSSNPDLLHPNGFVPKTRRRKYQAPFIGHLASLRNWFKETSKRARSPGSGSKASSGKSPTLQQEKSPDSRRRLSNANRNSQIHTHPNIVPSTHVSARPRISTNGSGKRPSVSPSPLTPRGSYRRSSGGLRGRKSTSSSISSIRSMPHHHHTHSKASSTSSASIASPAVSVSGHKHTKSPHASVKVLPATPTSSTFPSNIRLVRAPLSEGGAAFGVAPPASPGLVFAKRKRSPFKGPMLNLNTHGSPSAVRSRSEANSRSTSVQGRRSGDFMGIEEEDEDEIEEVEEFSPITRPGEFAEEVKEAVIRPLITASPPVSLQVGVPPILPEEVEKPPPLPIKEEG